MSTFVFAPNWVMYPNNPKLAKEVEFPSLNHTHAQALHNKPKGNVWSNPLLLQKIYSSTLSATEKYEEEEPDENRIELERLKALVPKTKKLLGSKQNHHHHNHHHHHHQQQQQQQQQQQTTKITSSKTSTKLTTSSSSSSSSSTSTTPVLKARISKSSTANKQQQQQQQQEQQPIQYVSEADKTRFIQFIKSWTRPGVPCNHSKRGSVAAVGYRRPLYNQEYVLFQ